MDALGLDSTGCRARLEADPAEVRALGEHLLFCREPDPSWVPSGFEHRRCNQPWVRMIRMIPGGGLA